MRSLIPLRRASANKGSFGRVLIVAGSINYIGAAYLACAGAARVGAGQVTLATTRSLQPVLAAKNRSEVTYLPLDEATTGIISDEAAGTVLATIDSYDVLLLGCGLGQAEKTATFVKKVLAGLPSPRPKLVLDADALNILSTKTGWWREFDIDAILTPHPGARRDVAPLWSGAKRGTSGQDWYGLPVGLSMA
jgi:NAD(P)H-hydrate epimerase